MEKQKTIIWILSIVIILGIAFYVGQVYLVPRIYNEGVKEGEINIVREQFTDGIIYGVNSTGQVVRVSVESFCQQILNQAQQQTQ